MVKRPEPRRPRGHTPLIAALIGRHDAQARRTAAKIHQTLSEMVPLEGVQRCARQLVAELATALDAIPATFVARCPALVAPDAVTALLRAEFAGILGALAEGLGVEAASKVNNVPRDPRGPAAEAPPPLRRSSPTLAEARAQSARLTAYLIDLKMRVVPYAPPTGPGEIYLPGDGSTNGHHPRGQKTEERK